MPTHETHHFAIFSELKISASLVAGSFSKQINFLDLTYNTWLNYCHPQRCPFHFLKHHLQTSDKSLWWISRAKTKTGSAILYLFIFKHSLKSLICTVGSFIVQVKLSHFINKFDPDWLPSFHSISINVGSMINNQLWVPECCTKIHAFFPLQIWHASISCIIRKISCPCFTSLYSWNFALVEQLWMPRRTKIFLHF